MHTDWLHEQVGLAGVVEKAAYVSHRSRVHERLSDGACTCMLPYSNDVENTLYAWTTAVSSVLFMLQNADLQIHHHH